MLGVGLYNRHRMTGVKTSKDSAISSQELPLMAGSEVSRLEVKTLANVQLKHFCNSVLQIIYFCMSCALQANTENEG